MVKLKVSVNGKVNNDTEPVKIENHNGEGEMSENEEIKGSELPEWYRTFFGDIDLLPTLVLRGGEEATVTILMKEPGIRFKNNEPWRPYLRVEHDGEIKVLWLHKKSLAYKILLLQRKYGSLEGLKVKIRAPTGEGDDRFYTVEVVE